MTQYSLVLSQDEDDARRYWADKLWKVYAVDVVAGPARRPSYRRTFYARAQTPERAIACVKRSVYPRPPAGARYHPRLAGPRELGCVPAAGRGAA
jgi:hypothetical protein